jgi:hypothetical protein
MGAYVYTRRNDVKAIGGEKLVRFDYSYKPSYSMDHGHDRWSREYRRVTAVKHAHAERALEATADIQYGILGEWKYAETSEGIPVYRVEGRSYVVDDSFSTNENMVGTLYKRGRKTWIVWKKG